MGKICLITGGTSGIGFELCKIFLKNKFKVYFTARDELKAKETKSKILEELPNGDLHYLIGDLSIHQELQKIISQFSNQENYLDLLINNAGCMLWERKVTAHGIEQQFAVNYLAPRYLNYALLPMLKKSERGRIVNVTSRFHLRGKINWKDLQGLSVKYSGQQTYSNTKLLLNIHSSHLANQLEGSNVGVVTVHPGVYSTGISRHLPKVFRWIWNAVIPSPEKGAEIVSKVALNENNNNVYFNKLKISKQHEMASDASIQEKLEKETAKLY